MDFVETAVTYMQDLTFDRTIKMFIQLIITSNDYEHGTDLYAEVFFMGKETDKSNIRRK